MTVLGGGGGGVVGGCGVVEASGGLKSFLRGHKPDLPCHVLKMQNINESII